MLESYTLLQIALAAAVVFTAFVVRGMSGFGASLVSISLIVSVLPKYTPVPVMSLAMLALFSFCWCAIATM